MPQDHVRNTVFTRVGLGVCLSAGGHVPNSDEVEQLRKSSLSTFSRLRSVKAASSNGRFAARSRAGVSGGAAALRGDLGGVCGPRHDGHGGRGSSGAL